MFGEAFDMNLNTKTQYTIRRIPRIPAGFFAMLTAAAAVLPCFSCSTYAQSQQIRFDTQTAQPQMHNVRERSGSYFTLSAASGASSAVGVNVFSAASVQPTADVPENQPSENKKPYVGFEEHVRTSGCYVVCPVFVCKNSVLVNAAVKTAFVEYAREQPADRYITYDVMYNDNDLLSIKMCVYVSFEQLNADYDVPTVNGYAVFETRPINIDILSGRILSVDDCFGVAFSDDFAADFGKKAYETAVSNFGDTVICLPEPIYSDRMFMFYDCGILLCYRKYELIADPTIEPTIYIPSEWFIEQGAMSDSLIGRLLFDETGRQPSPSDGYEFAD